MITCSGLKGRWLDLPRIQSIVGLMLTSFIAPIILLSLVPHQEPRFILPVILPLVFLYAPNVSQVPGVDTVARIVRNHANHTPFVVRQKLSKMEILWYALNIIFCLFYGFAHQGGVLPLTTHVAAELKAKPELTHIHLYTSHTYSIPTAILHLRNTKKTYISSGNDKYKLVKDFHLYEEGSRNIEEVCNKIAKKIHECEENYIVKGVPYRLYYALPATDMDEFIEYSFQNDTKLFNYHIVNRFYPHVTTEKLPVSRISNAFINFINLNVLSVESFTDVMNRISEFVQEFELVLTRIEYIAPKQKRDVES